MATTNFQLQPAIDNFIERLKIKKGFTPEDLDELKSHLNEATAELQSKGLSEEESFLVSSSRIGNENELATEYQKVNGKISGKANLLFIFAGMWLLTLFYFLWSLLKGIELNILMRYGQNPLTAFLIGLIPSLAIMVSLFCILNAGKLIDIMERLYYKNRANFSIVYLAAGLILILGITYLTGIISSTNNALLKINHDGVFALDSYSREITFWIMPAGVILISLYLLVKNGDKENGINKLINKAGFITFIGLGIIWETISAFTRFIMKDATMFLSAGVYAFVFSAAIFLLSKSLEERPFQKIILFSAFAIIIEGSAGFLNPLLTNGTFFSIYFYFLLGGVAIAYFSGRLSFAKNKTHTRS